MAIAARHRAQAGTGTGSPSILRLQRKSVSSEIAFATAFWIPLDVFTLEYLDYEPIHFRD